MESNLESLRRVIHQRRIRSCLPPPSKRRRIRERAGVSQEELAQVLGVSKVAISRWETGTRTPRATELCERYARALELMKLEAAS
jgi:DNA-binding XRE family transcriptional regulator